MNTVFIGSARVEYLYSYTSPQLEVLLCERDFITEQLQKLKIPLSKPKVRLKIPRLIRDGIRRDRQIKVNSPKTGGLHVLSCT